MTLKAGDVIKTFDLNGENVETLYNVCDQIGTQPAETVTKRGNPCYTIDYVLKFDKALNILHLKTYSGFKNKPALDSFKNDDHLVFNHAPINAINFADSFDFEIIGNVPPTNDDLEGYYDYLKQTDFEAYLLQTGKSMEAEQEKSNKFTDIGHKAFQDGDMSAAYHNYEMAVNLFPDAYTHNNMGRVEMAMDNVAPAIMHFEKAIDLIDPSSFLYDQFYRDLGQAYSFVGRYAEAKSCFQTALSNQKSLTDQDLQDIQEIEKDIADYHKKIKNRLNVGDIFIEPDHEHYYTLAVKDYHESIDQKPPFGDYDSQETYYCVWKILYMDDDYIHCRVYAGFKTKPTIENGFDEDYLSYTHMPIDYVGFEGLTSVANKPLNDSDLNGYYDYLKLNNFDLYLEKTGKNAKEVIKDSLKIYLEGIELQESGSYKRALNKYLDAIHIFPYEPCYYDALGWMQLHHGEYDNALNSAAYALELYSNDDIDDPEIKAKLTALAGYGYYHLHNDHMAITYLEEALNDKKHLDSITVKEIEQYLRELK